MDWNKSRDWKGTIMKKHLTISLVLALLLCLGTATAHAGSIAFTYDANGRLTAAEYSNKKTIAWTFDANGNPVRRAVMGNTLYSGDINGDGTVDLTDLFLILQVCAGMEPASDIFPEAGLPGAPDIGIKDALYLLEKITAEN